MTVPGFDFIFDAILGVFGIVLLLGIAIVTLFVVLRRRERNKHVESGGQDHVYADYPTDPPVPPTS